MTLIFATFRHWLGVFAADFLQTRRMKAVSDALCAILGDETNPNQLATVDNFQTRCWGVRCLCRSPPWSRGQFSPGSGPATVVRLSAEPPQEGDDHNVTSRLATPRLGQCLSWLFSRPVVNPFSWPSQANWASNWTSAPADYALRQS